MSETILKLYQDPVTAREMGMRGRKYLEEHFNRARIADDFIGMIEETVNSYGRKDINC
jgi:glycosyltransferase involved in cell wall biosynthesis